MRINFIGAGKVGCTLGKYFLEHGLEVGGYYSRTLRSAEFASDFTETTCFLTLEQAVRSSDVLFLTVSDGAIGQVWEEVRRIPVGGKIICHCSGVLSSKVFSGIGRLQASGYSIHPIYAIHSKTTSYQELGKAHFTIEGDADRLMEAREMIAHCGNPVTVIGAGQKDKYHAACVAASNLVVALASIASRLLEECGFSAKEAGEALTPLFLDNCIAVAQKGPIEALTGPVSRGDLETVKRHLAALSPKDRLWYLALSEELTGLAQKKTPGLDMEEMRAYIRRGIENDETNSNNISKG